MGIQYGYIIGLAPTQEIRDLQKQTDLNNHELKSERKQLGETFSKEYKSRILEKFDFNVLLEKLNQQGAHRIVFFCVEESAKACHRFLVTERLKNDFRFDVTNL